MIVFKSYLLMVKRNYGRLLLYFGIFIGIAVAMSIAGENGGTGDF